MALGLHSASANDLVRFLISVVHELEELVSPVRVAQAITAVVQCYADALQKKCETATRSSNVLLLSEHLLSLAVTSDAKDPKSDASPTKDILQI